MSFSKRFFWHPAKVRISTLNKVIYYHSWSEAVNPHVRGEVLFAHSR